MTGDLECRLARLERSNRRLRASLAVCVLVAVAAGANLREGIQDEVRARKVSIVADNGRSVITLGSDRNDKPSLDVYEPNGTRRVRLTTGDEYDNRASLWMYHPKDGSAIWLGLDQYEDPSLSLYDMNEHERLRATVEEKGHWSAVAVMDNQAAVRAELQVGGPKDEPTLKFFSKEEKPVAVFPK